MTHSDKLIGIGLAGGLSVVLALGCGGGTTRDVGPTGEVSGTVTMDGEPLTQGAVSFYNPDSGDSGGGELGEGGQFKFETPVPVGSYQVAIIPPDAPQPDDEASAKKAEELAALIPTGYQTGATSGIVVEVKEEPNSFEFKLSSSGPAGGGDVPP